MSHQAMNDMEETNTYQKVKEASVKSPHTVQSQRYDILEKEKPWKQ